MIFGANWSIQCWNEWRLTFTLQGDRLIYGYVKLLTYSCLELITIFLIRKLIDLFRNSYNLMTDICEINVSILIFITRKFDLGGGCKQRNKPITMTILIYQNPPRKLKKSEKSTWPILIRPVSFSSFSHTQIKKRKH